MKRITSIDITRGIVMVIMALDHVRDLMHVDSITQSPTNLQTTTPILFFTRWITYLCAPAFVFLAGTSAYLSLTRSKNVRESRNFLFKRGFYLILLDLIIVDLALFFDPGYHTILFEVIAAIGFGFIILGLLYNASAKTVGIMGLLILCCHNLIPLIPLSQNSTGQTVLNLLFNQTAIPLPGNRVFVMAYPPIPWVGIMLIGFAIGGSFVWPAKKRQDLFTWLAIVALVTFVILRFINVYGDPAIWSSQKTVMFTFLSFMNVTKYPPSLLFCLVTLGIMFFMIVVSEGSTGKVGKILAVYGKVPLFYFLVHFFLIHLLLLGLLLLQGFTWDQMNFTSGTFGRPGQIPSGIQLWAIYLIWIGVVIMLYKPCLWFGKYKAANRYWWLKYI
ncbi:MAG TPA: heparan-alpha-glucosaminide N-acetyltransferase domain-containing protein, partial [Flavisolibacter sp.]|nr:heparan-alpha-glucosaminide N-acetyltransferase domain-containing protein [Flavisolibacter sp.]